MDVSALAVILAAGLAGQGLAAPKRSQLVAFRSCPDLLRYVKAHAAPFVTASGLGRPVGLRATPGGALVPSAGATAPQQGVDYSGTNVQEAGVDEPDIAKTNGTTLFAVENNQLEAVDVSAAAPKLLDTLNLGGVGTHVLLLSGTHLLVLSRGGYWAEPLPAQPALLPTPIASSSTLTEVDVSDPAALKVVRTLTLDGTYLDARMIGSTIRVVSSSAMPIGLPYVTPAGATGSALAAAKTKNQAVVASSRATAWLPSYRLGKRPRRALVSCRDVRRPPSFSGLGLLTVTTIDLAHGLAPIDSTAVLADGRIVYASPSSLYVATERWTMRPLPAAPTVPPSPGANVTTEIHAFDISDPARTTYLGSGTVPGYLLSQWSLSEFQGVLRVVSTDTPAWWGSGPASQSYLTTLRQQNQGLVQVGQVGGLGQGDRVYAVRLIGDTGYVVTFRQVDPLYTVDLHDPAQPRVLGQLELPGYSSYLHPISGNLLLGIGQNVDPQTNEPTGTQVSLFDVSDPKHPTRLARATLGQGWSAAESDHHAFLYWPATGLVVVPFGQQAVAMHVSRTTGITELGRIVHERARQSTLPQIDRSVVVGNTLLTISSAGVESNGLATLASLGWAAFPLPATGPSPMPLPGGAITPKKPPHPVTRLLARARAGGETFHALVEGDVLHRLRGNAFDAPEPTGETIPLTAATLLCPVEPRRIYVVLGGFFRPGTDEEVRPPRIIPKVVGRVSGDGGEIVIPPYVEGTLWAEVEIAVVVGAPLHRAVSSEAAEAILGYGVFNDACAADYLQHGPSGYFQAKSVETFASLGPWLRTDLVEDELRAGLRLEARVGDELKASGTTALARWAPSDLLAWLSRYVALGPGDVVALGTPQPCEVQRGDTVELEVEGIGVLRNRFVAEAPDL